MSTEERKRVNAHATKPAGTAWRRAEPQRGDGPRVLLLTSTLGSGHLRAAVAIERNLVRAMRPGAVRLLDFWSLMDSHVALAVKSAYLRLIRDQPGLFDHLYGLDLHTWRNLFHGKDPLPQSVLDAVAMLPPVTFSHPLPRGGVEKPVDRLMLFLLGAALAGKTPFRHGNNRLVRAALLRSTWWILARRMASQLTDFRPDVVVATQMNAAALLPQTRSEGNQSFKLIAVPTDFGLHDFWVQPRVDYYCVPHETVEGLDHPGLAGRTILYTGIPLMPGFSTPPDPTAARRSLGLDGREPVVLVAGGGLGLGVERVTERLLNENPVVRIIVCAADNQTAVDALERLRICYPERLRIVRWTDHMERLLRAADVIIGKPGGLSVAETLACGRPFLATRSLLGQEGFNTRFLERHGVGRLLPEEALPGVLDALLTDQARLRAVGERAWQLGRRDGTTLVARLVLSMDVSAAPARSQPEESAP